MTKSQLELALREAGKIARDRDFIVFGSQCILGTVARPPRACLISQELDLYPRSHPQAVMLLVQELGARSRFSRREGFFVDCVTPDLALQRRFKRFPFFEFFEAAFTVGFVGLVVASGMVLQQCENIAGLAFGLRKTALH